VAVPARAYDLLMALIDHRDRVVGKEELLNLVWPEVVVEEHNLHTQVSTLRKLIGVRAIATVPGRGYRFVGQIAVASPATAPNPPSKGSDAPDASNLLGRESDLDRALDLLTGCRLLTLLGPGGVGKTTLAKALVQRLRQRGEVHWVGLTEAADGQQLLATVVDVLEMGASSASSASSLAHALAHRDCTLVLDNCEHIASEVSALISELIGTAPRIRFLTTSRQPLKVGGEQRYFLDGLAVPADGNPFAVARAAAAVRLLEGRARLADARFSLDASTINDAVALCRALDGNPLAIEMAAARVRMFGLRGVVLRLGERLRLLSNDARGGSRQQASLAATLNWSFSLLSPQARLALQRLSAFVGSFSVEAAQRMVSGDGTNPLSAADAVGELLDQSMLATVERPPQRLRMLETTRLYAMEVAAQQGELDMSAQRHDAVVAEIGVESRANFWSMTDETWLSTYADDLPDLLVAFDRAAQRGDAEVTAAAAIALRTHIHLRSFDPAIERRAPLVLALLPQASALASARIWTFLSALNFIVPFEGMSKVEVTQQRLASWRALDSIEDTWEALCRLALDWAGARATEEASQAATEAAGLMGPDWPARRRFMFARCVAELERLRGNTVASRDKLIEATRLAAEAGSISGVAHCRLLIAEDAMLAGDLDEVMSQALASKTLLQRHRQSSGLRSALAFECSVHLLKGVLPEAAAVAMQVMEAAHQDGLVEIMLAPMSLLAAQGGRYREAAQLLGASDAWNERFQTERGPCEAMLERLASAAIDQAVGSKMHQGQRALGRNMGSKAAYSLATAVARELCDLATSSERSPNG